MSEKKEFTRAEHVRLRREQESTKRMQRVAEEATRPVPPVTIAHQTGCRAVEAQACTRKTSARRRFQNALCLLHRAEMRSHQHSASRVWDARCSRSCWLRCSALRSIWPTTFRNSV